MQEVVMKRTAMAVLAAGWVFLLGGCGADARRTGGFNAPADLAQWVWNDDSGVFPGDDLAQPTELNLCGDFDPQCQEENLGPDHARPFPLPSDPMPDPN